MRWWRKRKDREHDLERELASDLELEATEQRENGLSAEEARYAARRAFGNTTLVKEEVREMWAASSFDTFLQDVRYGLRQLRRNPGFTIVGILTLALGIGASTAIFSVVDAVLLRALPYPNPQQVVRVWEQAPDGHRMNLANANFEDFRAQNTTFTRLAAYGDLLTSVSGGREPVRARVAIVSSGFFEVFSVKPFRGRGFSAEEHRPHGAPAAIVSYSYWQHYFAGATDLSKFRLKLMGGVYPVTGVMPAGFDFPTGVAVWIPSELDPDLGTRTAHNWRGIGRIRNGIAVAQARANLSAIARRIKNEYGKKVDLNDAAVVPLADAMVGDVRTALLTLLGAVGLLLLVACANVAGLLVARTSARRKELAVRVALGAGRLRLIQQFLAESSALSFAGGLLGVLLAISAIRALPAILPANLPRQQEIAMNTPVLLFALGATITLAASLALFAAWRSVRGDVQEDLTAGSRTYAGGVASHKSRGFLVTGEIALTLVILIGAGLLSRSFLRLISTSPGFRQANLVTIQFSLSTPLNFYQDEAAIARQIQQLDDLVARLHAIPGVQSLGLAGAMPVTAGDNLADGDFLILTGQKAPATFDEWGRMALNPSQTGHALYAVASEGYFRTLGISLIRGRMFGDQDGLNAPHVALISQTLARERWPNQDPIGQVIDFGNMDGNLKPQTIIGVVGDVRARGLDSPPSPIIYVDYRQRGMNLNSSPTVLIRTTVSLGEIAPIARRIFHDLAPDVPVKFSTFADEMGGWLADRRFLLLLVGLFAGAALALAAVGVYGVVAFSVTRRTQEIGVRMSLGAQRGDVLRLILGEAARLAVLGVAIGIAASLVITRLLSSLLFGVSATDPVTFAGVAVLLSVIALLASYIPARRAMRVDPNVALRYE
ncbi:MAG: ADOP family duplicated permease [Bryobacteraceae bacterium]